MNYKETLFFIGKCLTITHEKHNLEIISEKIINQLVDWNNVVKVSTEHYVFPALYCNLKRANLLIYVPDELVNYMKYISDLNRERNLQLIEQAKEISTRIKSIDEKNDFGAGILLDILTRPPEEND